MFSEKRGNVLHGVLLIALFSCSASLSPAYKSGSSTFSNTVNFGNKLYC